MHDVCVHTMHHVYNALNRLQHHAKHSTATRPSTKQVRKIRNQVGIVLIAILLCQAYIPNKRPALTPPQIQEGKMFRVAMARNVSVPDLDLEVIWSGDSWQKVLEQVAG